MMSSSITRMAQTAGLDVQSDPALNHKLAVYLHVSDNQATEVLVTGIAQAGAIQRRENHPRGLAIENRKAQLALLGQRV